MQLLYIGLPFVWTCLVETGISKKASNLMLKFLQKQMQKQHKIDLKEWQSHCDYSDITSSLFHVGINFLPELVNDIGQSTVASARSSVWSG